MGIKKEKISFIIQVSVLVFVLVLGNILIKPKFEKENIQPSQEKSEKETSNNEEENQKIFQDITQETPQVKNNQKDKNNNAIPDKEQKEIESIKSTSPNLYALSQEIKKAQSSNQSVATNQSPPPYQIPINNSENNQTNKGQKILIPVVEDNKIIGKTEIFFDDYLENLDEYLEKFSVFKEDYPLDYDKLEYLSISKRRQINLLSYLREFFAQKALAYCYGSGSNDSCYGPLSAAFCCSGYYYCCKERCGDYAYIWDSETRVCGCAGPTTYCPPSAS